MGTFCPIIKEECREEACKAWRETECLFLGYLDMRAALTAKSIENIEERERRAEKREEAREELPVPPVIDNLSSEELGSELAEYAKSEPIGADRRIHLDHGRKRLFWRQKGVEDRFRMPIDLQLKIEEIENVAQGLLDKEREEQTRARLKSERGRLPELVDDCVSWARTMGLSRLTRADITGYPMEDDILPETLRLLWARVNVELKAHRQE